MKNVMCPEVYLEQTSEVLRPAVFLDFEQLSFGASFRAIVICYLRSTLRLGLHCRQRILPMEFCDLASPSVNAISTLVH